MNLKNIRRGAEYEVAGARKMVGGCRLLAPPIRAAEETEVDGLNRQNTDQAQQVWRELRHPVHRRGYVRILVSNIDEAR